MNQYKYALMQCVLPLTALLIAGVAQAADYKFTPSITVNEEFTDNIAEDKAKTLGSEFITRAIPGLAFHYTAPFWVWDVGYKYEYRYYAQNKRHSEDLHNLNLKTRWSLIDEKLFLDVSDEYSRVSLDQTRDRIKESLFTNQSDQNTFTVSPNYVLRPTSKLTLRPGVAYQNIWYKQPDAFDRNIYSGYLNSNYEITDKFSLISTYIFALTDAEGNISRTHDLQAGIKYEYAKNSFISVQGGNSWYMSSKQESSNPVWTVAINYAGDRYNLKASTSEKYSNDPTSNKLSLNTNYDLGCDWTFNKGKVVLTSGIVRLKEMPDNQLLSISYNNSASITYEIFTDWEAKLSYGYNYIDIMQSNTYTTIQTINTGITYLYSKDLRFSLNYRNIHMYSPGFEVDNKDINNAIFEVSKTF